MNRYEKDVLENLLKNEKGILSKLKKIYEQALEDVNEKIMLFMADELTQSKIYQIEYQRAVKGQVSAILDNLNANQYEDLQGYLKGCYEDGFIGTLYNLQALDVPLIFPINQKQIVDALMLDSKISEGLYTKLGNNIKDLKKHISAEISRGLSTSSSYADMARNINNRANITINQSMRIVRTEGHRIQNQAALDVAEKAKSEGCDIVKVWDSTLDGKTRPHHQQLDGQVRETDENFEINGLTASAPGHFGKPSEDCNCRCVCLIKPMWDLDEEFTKRNNETGELMQFDNVQNYEDFKKKYWDFVDNSGESGIIKVGNDDTSRNLPNGLRTAPGHILTEKEILSLKSDIANIGAEESVFRFNTGRRTGYDDMLDEIRVCGDVLPDEKSTHPRDKMSQRAVLAHEYYGHREFKGTTLPIGSWNDEFRASYTAAKNCPNLSDEDRVYLILDAVERAKEAGVSIRYNDFMRRILYGY